MDYSLIRESFPLARKSHKCVWCGQAIEPGEKHRHEISRYDGLQDFRWHLECDEAAKEVFADGDTEFMRYSHERGSV